MNGRATSGGDSDDERLSIIELRARLAKMEVELLAARRLNVDEINTKNGPLTFADRHGMVGVFLAVFVQTAGVIWWASTITGQVHDIQRTIESQQQTQHLMSQTLQVNAERLTRVQTVQENVIKLLDRYEEERIRTQGGGERGPVPR